ncbi:MAG: glutamate--cysteine ligase [Alphaproteobacteria bacterium]
MAAPPSAGGDPITSKRQLVEWLEAGQKPKSAWRVGTEHEKFVFRIADRRRAPYEGPDGIGALLTQIADRFGWRKIEENGNVVALSRDDCNITLEPGGQFELSGAPLETLHQTCREANEHLEEARAVCADLGLGMLGVGFDPEWRQDEMPWMPKGRYKVMRRYMPKVGGRGLDMMTRTCTIQSNLDFGGESDMVEKFRISLALQPLATALFANSPFVEGMPTGRLSERSYVWTDTDPDRCGMLDFVFEDGFGFERYCDYLLDTPMYFAYRDGKYVDVAGESFRDFMAGKLPQLPGEVPHMGDWADHVTTSFPEVRLKRFLEMRGADGGPWSSICALSAFWVGLLYDDAAQKAAWSLVKDWTQADRAKLRDEAPIIGLKAEVRGRTLQDVARDAIRIARDGLVARARLDSAGDSEAGFLTPLEAIAASGVTPADEKLALFSGPWGRDIRPIYKAFAY